MTARSFSGEVRLLEPSSDGEMIAVVNRVRRDKGHVGRFTIEKGVEIGVGDQIGVISSSGRYILHDTGGRTIGHEIPDLAETRER